MAVDPILAYHAVGFHRYELSCLRTRNVRDQILRGELLVERLADRGDIALGRDLLVVGGGAAGLACALAACSRGIDVVVIEIEKSMLSKQYGVRSRWLDPCEFDWPQPHWRDRRMGSPGAFTLDFAAGSAHEVAVAWRATLADVTTGTVALPGMLSIYRGDARKIRFRKLHNSGRIGASPWPGWPDGRPFGVLISCIGFEGEKTAIRSIPKGALHGPLFWAMDDLDLPDLGVAREDGGDVRALVSGGGDGAQQDFLRILTGKFGLELYDALDLPRFAREIPRLADALLAEDVALRALSASVPGVALPHVHQRWHRAFERVAGSIWRSWRRTGALPTLTALLKPGVQATWLIGDNSPGYCYGLNRLLATLVARLHGHAQNRPHIDSASSVVRPGVKAPVIITGARAHSVTPSDSTSHVCGSGCYGHEHEVEVSVGPGVTFPLGLFDVIVPRHGIIQAPLVGSPPVHEQRVAFDRPA